MDPSSIQPAILGILVCSAIVLAFAMKRRWIQQAWKRGMDAFHRNEFAEARNAFRYIVKKNPGWASARRMLARGLAGLGEHVEAEKELRFATQLEPRNPAGHIDLAVLLVSMSHERDDEALSCLETALEVSPDVRRALATLPQLRALHGNARFRDLAGLPDVDITPARLN